MDSANHLENHLKFQGDVQELNVHIFIHLYKKLINPTLFPLYIKHLKKYKYTKYSSFIPVVRFFFLSYAFLLYNFFFFTLNTQPLKKND